MFFHQHLRRCFTRTASKKVATCSASKNVCRRQRRRATYCRCAASLRRSHTICSSLVSHPHSVTAHCSLPVALHAASTHTHMRLCGQSFIPSGKTQCNIAGLFHDVERFRFLVSFLFAGPDNAYVMNFKPLSKRCATLDETIDHLANGAPGPGRHPDIRVRPIEGVSLSTCLLMCSSPFQR